MNDNRTKEAFNKSAPFYDKQDNANAILLWMRKMVHTVYMKHFKKGDRLLELNAGTGEDAVFLASNGFSVYATDISDKMIERANEKISGSGFNELVKTGVFSFGEISSIEENDFDGVISNFGGLNCINDFEKLSADLSAKLKPDKIFIAVVMNKFCPWEIFYYLLKFDFKNAFRRFKKEGIMADLNGNKVLTYYFSPKVFSRFFAEQFCAVKICSLGFFTPPPYAIGIYNYFKPVVRLFMRIDSLLMGLYPFSRFGDHFIIVLKKRNA